MPSGYITGHKNVKQISTYGPPVNVPVTLNKSKLYCDPTFIVIPNPNNNDVRLNSAGVVNMFLGAGIETTNFDFGSLWISGTIKYSDPGFNQNSSVIACIKAASTGSEFFASTSTSWPIAQTFGTVMDGTSANSPGVYVEGVARDDVFSSSAIAVLPGTYYFEWSMYFDGAPGATTLAFSSNATFTRSFNGVTETAPVNALNGYYEWVNTPNTILAPVTGSGQIGTIRFSDSSPGSDYCFFNVNQTTTNSVAPILMSLVLMRLPDAISLLYGSEYPRGNLDGSISKPRHAVVPLKEYESFVEFMKHKDDYIVVSQQEEKKKEVEDLSLSSKKPPLLKRNF